MMGRETYADFDDETIYTRRQDKYKTLSSVQMSRFVNSLHRMFGQSFGILPTNLVNPMHSSGNYSPTAFNFDHYAANPIHEVQGRLRNLQPFKNDIGYFPTPDFQYSQCQENIPEFYLTSQSSVETTSLEAMMEESFRRPPPITSSNQLQPLASNLHYPSPFPSMYTFFVPVYPCYVIIPTVPQNQMRN